MKFVPRLPQIAKRPKEPSLLAVLRGPGEDPKLTEAQRAGIGVSAQLHALDAERYAAGTAARAAEAKAKTAADNAAYERYLARAGRAARCTFDGPRR